jgi:hypothetical protein
MILSEESRAPLMGAEALRAASTVMHATLHRPRVGTDRPEPGRRDDAAGRQNVWPVVDEEERIRSRRE